jgi:putative AlgH/UPF0301 family transcriptional regulator
MHDYRGTLRVDPSVDSAARKAFSQFGGKPIWLGGPVLHSDEDLRSSLKSDPSICAHAIHQWSDIPGCTDLGCGVYEGGSWDHIGERGSGAKAQARLLIGRSVWAPLQLEAEISQGVWMICNPRQDFIFSDVEDPDEADELMQMPIPFSLGNQKRPESSHTYRRLIRPPYSIRAPPEEARTLSPESTEAPEQPAPPKLPPGYQPHDLWRNIMAQLGGEYYLFSQLPRNLPSSSDTWDEDDARDSP